MSILGDALTLYAREFLIFKKNINVSVARSVMFPLVFILLLGNIGNTSKNLPVAIVNYDNGINSIKFINLLEAANIVRVLSVTNQQSALNMLYMGQVTMVIVIPPHFGTNNQGSQTLTTYLDSSVPFSTTILVNQVEQTAKQFDAQVLSKGINSANMQQSPTTSFNVNYTYGTASDYKDFLIAGVMLSVVIFGALWSGGFTMLTDRQLGNLKTFLVTPIHRFSILLSKLGMGVTQSTMAGIFALVIGILDGGHMACGLYGVALIFMFIVLASIGFGALAIILATRTSKIETYSITGTMIMMPMWFLSGAFSPTNTFPPWLQFLSAIDPLTYAVDGVRYLFLKGFIPTSVLITDVVVLIIFSVISLIASVLLFKNTIE